MKLLPRLLLILIPLLALCQSASASPPLDEEPLREFTLENTPAYSVAFSPNGQLLAVARKDRTVTLWDIASGQVARTLQGFPGRVEAVAFSPDGYLFAAGGEYNTVKVWNATTWEELHTLTVAGRTTVSCLAFSPDSLMLAAGSENHNTTLWDALLWRQTHYLIGHTNQVRSVSFLHDGKALMTRSWDNTVKIWDVASGKLLKTLSGVGVEKQDDILAVSPDGKRVIMWVAPTMDNNGKWIMRDYRVLDAANWRLLYKPDIVFSRSKVFAFSPDGNIFATSSISGIDFFDVATGEIVRTLNVDKINSLKYLTFSPDGSKLAAVTCFYIGNYLDVLGIGELLGPFFAPVHEGPNTIRVWEVPKP